MGSSDDLDRNRAGWDRITDEYHDRHAAAIEPGLAWGMWQIPEAELDILGDVAGKDVLELGCGEAEWSRALARLGARPVGLDLSPLRLARAREALDRDGLHFPLIEAPAQAVPLPDASFDVVFCDHGAMGFADPLETVPEAARLLRPGGLLAFSLLSHLAFATFDPDTDDWTAELRRDWFELRRLDDWDEIVQYTLPHGEWIALLRANGFEVERLVEVRPPDGARSTYVGDEQSALARRFPMEEIWSARKTH